MLLGLNYSVKRLPWGGSFRSVLIRGSGEGLALGCADGDRGMERVSRS